MRYLSMLALTLSLLTSAAACDTSEPKPPEDAVLINQTGEPLLYYLYPAFSDVSVPDDTVAIRDLDNPPAGLHSVAAGDSSTLWPCKSLQDLEGWDLLLYKINASENGQTAETAHLEETMTSSMFLKALRANDCRLMISNLESP